MLAFSIIFTLAWILFVRFFLRHRISNKESIIHFLIVVPAITLIYFLVSMINLYDTELRHGYVTDKIRSEKTYEESYSCRCKPVTKGTGDNAYTVMECETCYRDVYTVNWYMKTTLGNIDLDYEKSYSKSIWKVSDPNIYKNVVIGEICSDTYSYTNYIKNSNSLFNAQKYNVITKVPIPDYPQVYNTYKVNNVLNVNTQVDVKTYENVLDERLKILAQLKQLNIIIIFVNTLNKNYKYELEKSWIGGKKNDLVVILGTTNNQTIEWVDAFTIGMSIGNQMLITVLKDDLIDKSIEPQIIEIITSNAKKYFTRKSMETFKYLTYDITDSLGKVIFLLAIQIFLNVVITYFFYKEEF